LAADFRTKTGEQRQLALAANVTVDLNTHTSVALRRDATANALQGVELLDGEIAVNTTRAAAQPFIVAAGPGRAEATQANFEVRNLDTRVCVTCLSGDVRVDANGRSVMLTANQQVTYGKHAMSAVMAADAATTSAWRSGVLVFRQTPLSDVVDEINRYRPGHVLVVDSKLERSSLNGRFRIDKLDTVFAQMHEVLGAKVTELPGGIVLLG
jgi:transmembrane sensor